MTRTLILIKRLLWPERASLFVIIGGAAGLAGDLTSFFAEFISPGILVAVFTAIALGSALLCIQRALLVDAKDSTAIEHVVHCGVCDAMRFSLFAVAAFVLLMLIGQGKTATETVGSQLGLIQSDVRQISQDIQVVGQDVREIGDVVQSHKIILNPKNASDFFTNAWISSNVHRDSAKAFKAMQDLYERHGPVKLDAAELYYSLGRNILARQELLAEMEKLGIARNDATLLVVAGRNATDAETSHRLYEKAKEIDPDLPFAYWDMQNTTQQLATARTDMESQQAALKQNISNIEQFLARIANKPTGAYFYLPQYQGDYETIARQMLDGFRRTMETYERINTMKANTKIK